MGKSLIIKEADFSANKIFSSILAQGILTIQSDVMSLRDSPSQSTYIKEAVNNADKWGTDHQTPLSNPGDYALNEIPTGCTKITVTCPAQYDMSVGVSYLNSNGKYSALTYIPWTSGGLASLDFSEYADRALFFQINFQGIFSIENLRITFE